MRVYISGPIAGRPDRNREAFAKAEAFLKQGGHDTVNPLDGDPGWHDTAWWLPLCFGKETDRPEDLHRYGCYLLGDLLVLAECDALYQMPDWRESPGARAEAAFAEACGIPVIEG